MHYFNENSIDCISSITKKDMRLPVSTIQVTNGTFQVFEVQGGVFNANNHTEWNVLLFEAFTSHSATVAVTITGLESDKVPISVFKEHLKNHTLVLSSVIFDINGDPCRKTLLNETMSIQTTEKPAVVCPSLPTSKLTLVPIDFEGVKDQWVENGQKNGKEERPEEVEENLKDLVEESEGKVYTKTNEEEFIEKQPDNSVLKKKVVQTKHVVPVVQKRCVNKALQKIERRERVVKVLNEEYGLVVPNAYIEPDASLYDFNFIYDWEERDDDKADCHVTTNSFKMFLKQTNALDIDSSSKKASDAVVEGPIFEFIGNEVDEEKLKNGNVLKKKTSTTIFKKPLYKVYRTPSGIKRRLFIREKVMKIDVVENMFEIPLTLTDFNNIFYETSLKESKEVLDDGVMKSVKRLLTRVVDGTCRGATKVTRTVTCPEEIHFEVTGISKFQEQQEAIESHQVITAKHVVPSFELTYRVDDVPQIKTTSKELRRQVFDIVVNVDCGFIEPFAENCDLSIVLADEAVVKPSQAGVLEKTDKQNIYDNVQSLKQKQNDQGVKKVTYGARIKAPRYVQKLIEGNIQIRNSEEEFTLKSQDGASVKRVKIITSQFFKPITMVTECNGKVVKSSKVEKLVKTTIRENVLEMPAANLDPSTCQISIELQKQEDRQLDSSMLIKSSTKMLLKNPQKKAQLLEGNQSGVNPDNYHVKDDVLNEHVTFDTNSPSGALCHHKVKTTSYIKKYFKRVPGTSHKNMDLSLKGPPPDLIKVLKQFVREEVFERPSNAKDFNAGNMEFSISDNWLEDTTPCGAPRKKHLVMVKAHMKQKGAEDGVLDGREAKDGMVEEFEGTTQTETEETESEKSMDNLKFKQKVVTTKHIRPVTTLKYHASGRLPEVSTREDLLRVEINEYLFELDKDLSDPNECVSTVESYNYIKYMSNGIPLNTEVTKITARLKKNAEKSSADEVSKDDKVESFDLKNNLLPVQEEAPEKLCLVPVVAREREKEETSGSTSDFSRAHLSGRSVRHKVCTTENSQQLKNGDFIKSKNTTTSFVQVDKVLDNDINDFVEKTVKRDVSEVNVHLPNNKIEAFALNCYTAVNARIVKTMSDTSVELNKMIMQCMVELKSKLTDDKYSNMKSNNLFLPLNACYELGEPWSRQMVELQAVKIDNSTKHYIRKTTKYTSRPMYLRSQGAGESCKSLVDVCNEEVEVVEAIYEVRAEQKSCLSLESLRIVSNEYEEHFEDGCVYRTRRVKIASCPANTELEENEDGGRVEKRVRVADRSDEFNSDGSLKRWLVATFSSVVTRITPKLTRDLFYVDVEVVTDTIESKTLEFELLLTVCDLYVENNFRVDIDMNRGTTEQSDENTHSVMVHVHNSEDGGGGKSIEKKSYRRGEVQKKVKEDEKKTRLVDGRLVKWKTMTREIFLPLIETAFGLNDVTQLFLVKIEIYVVVVEIGGEELVVDEAFNNNDYTDIVKEYECIHSPEGIPVEKTMIKYTLNPSKLNDDTRKECHGLTRKTRTVESDEEALENGGRMYKQIVKCLALKPYYEISENKNPMLKEHVVSEDVEETWVKVQEGVDLGSGLSSNCKVEHDRILVKYDEVKSTVINVIAILKADQHLVFEEYNANVEASKDLLRGCIECEDRCCENHRSGKTGFIKDKEWTKEFFVPLIGVKCSSRHTSPEISTSKNLLHTQITKASLSIPNGSLNVHMVTPAIETNLEEGDLINTIENYVSDSKKKKIIYKKTFNVRVEIKPLSEFASSSFRSDAENFVEETKEEDVKQLLSIEDILDMPIEVETMPVETGARLVRKVADEMEKMVYEGEIRSRVDVSEDEEEDVEGRRIKKKTITTTYFRFVLEKVYRNNEEIVSAERVEDLCKEVEEIYLSMPAESLNGELGDDFSTETVVQQCDDEISVDNLPLKRKTIWMTLKNTGSTDKLNNLGVDQTKRVEGDIISSTSIAECSSLMEDGSKSVCKRSTTRFFRPVAFITLCAGSISQAVINEETNHYDVTENVTLLCPGVSSFNDPSVSIVVSEESSNEKTPDGIPVVKNVKMTKYFKKSNKEGLDLQEAEETDEDNPIEVIEELVGGTVYKNLVINVKDSPSFAKTKSIFPKLFLKQSEMDACVKVHCSTFEESPVVRSRVQECLNVLPDNTKVKRRLTETAQKKTVVRRMAYEDSCCKEFPDALEKVNGECLHVERNADVAEKGEFKDCTENGQTVGKLSMKHKKQKFVTQTKFVLASVANNGIDDFFETF